ncbi:MAG: glycosyltransferase family 1 protein, partial [Cyanobacteria bacterium J06573_2]
SNFLAISFTSMELVIKLEQVFLGEIVKPSREECREYAVNNFNWDKIAQEVRKVILGEGK